MPDRNSLQAELERGLAALRLDLPESAVSLLLDYLDLLVRWNKAYNLTAVRDPVQMITRHLLDSLAVLPFVHGATLADLGSGAGLPGIPLAIARPGLRATLVDSNGKKARFLREAARALPLENVKVQQGRVEDLPGSFDCITARAFASLGDMLAWGGHALAPDGVWLALKGQIEADELARLPAGFRVEAIRALDVPGLDAQRHLVEIRRA
ncbi:MAG TPA: 16S rRNA (guanine(527)-N(7))-methyltransferase RsmG [Rhodanobacteraceae bacterium]|nr:16S rRNA (guanine(527)-N(7))-methyltransferase RsmG [Rhodanobacteraceae bacterium]